MARPDNWVPLCKRDHINVFWIAAICLNQLATNFIWTPIGALTNPYCQKLSLNNVATTFVQLIGSFVGLTVPPLVAAWSDTTTLKLGRRRPWMIGSEILVLVGLMLTSFCREVTGFSDTNKSKRGACIAVFVIGQIMASVGGNAENGPGRSMCSDVVPPSQQVLVSNICTLYCGIAGVISNLIGALKLYKYTSFENETLVLMISCIINGVSIIISVVVTPEEPLLDPPEVTNPFMLIVQSFKDLTKQTLFLNVGCFFCALGSTMFDWQHTNFIGKIIFKGVATAENGTPEKQLYDDGISHAQLLALIQTIVQVTFSFFNTPIVNKIGLRNAWFLGMGFTVIGDIFFFFKVNKWLYIIAYFSHGISKVISGSVPYAMISLVSPPEKLAGTLTNIIFFNNIGALVAQFALSMGLNSIGWFSENPGRGIAIPFTFILCAIACGFIGYAPTSASLEHVDDSEMNSDESDSDKPTAL